MKRGFTLIELLAVIVILAIIAVIAVPIVIDIIDDSKKNSSLRSAEMYLDAVEISIANRTMNHGVIPNDSYPIMRDGNICLEKYEETETSESCIDEDSIKGNEILKVEVKGDIPNRGSTIDILNGNVDNIFFIYGNNGIEKNELNEITYIKDPKSFTTDDWDTISKNIKVGNLSKYNVGDTKEIELKGFINGETDSNGLYTIKISNKTNTGDVCTKDYYEYEDGSKEKYSKTACGFVIEFEDIIEMHNINPSGEYKGTQYDNGWNLDGYPSSLMYTYLQNSIYIALPDELKNVIIPTTVISGHGATEGEKNFTTVDNIYLLSGTEIYGSDSSDTSEFLTRQLDYYKNYKNSNGDIGVTTTNYSGAIKNFNGIASTWWLRTARSLSTISFRYVNYTGKLNNSNATKTYGVVVAFRIG